MTHTLIYTAVYVAVCTGLLHRLYHFKDVAAELEKEVRFLKAENRRLEEARKEPTTVEAIAALAAKCKRNTLEDCGAGCKDPVLKSFCYKYVNGALEDTRDVVESVGEKMDEYMERGA